MTPNPFLDFLVVNTDPYGDPHAANVSSLASLLAISAGLTKQEILHIEIAAKYHDLGKLFIPEAIRRHPGLFTPFERHAIQKHSEIGAQMLQLLDFDPQVIAIVLGHHENFDGTGYPSALRRDKIPLGARVIRIVDSYDALTNYRGYRPACSQKRALERIQEAERLYDPELLATFAEIIKSKWAEPPPASFFTPRGV